MKIAPDTEWKYASGGIATVQRVKGDTVRTTHPEHGSNLWCLEFFLKRHTPTN